MGKAGRFSCIFLPLVLTIASLVCLVIVGLGGTNEKDSALNNLYFLKANTSNITISSTLTNVELANGNLKSGSGATTASLGLANYYTVSLWNYCSGNGHGSVNCTKPHTQFYFNPVDVWKLNDTAVAENFRKELDKGLSAYKTATKWMYIAYIIAIVTTAVELLMSILAIFSRWGSFFTSLISSVASFFYILFAIAATAIYASLLGTFNGVLKSYGIKTQLGRSMYITLWLGVAFTLASGFFWLISSCCCSGRSNPKRTRAEKTPYTYERMPSPHMPPASGHQNQYGGSVPMGPVGNKPQNLNSAYEPFRHEQV